MYGSVAQNAAAGQKSRVNDQHKSEQVEQIGAANRIPGASGDQIGVNAGDQDQPGYQRHILYRIPGPVSAERQGFVSPGAAHENAGTEDRPAEQRPG